MGKTIKIQFNGKEEEVELKKLSWPERNRLLKNYSSITIVGSTPRVTIDVENKRNTELLASIVKAPFPISMEGLGLIDADECQRIYLEASELNGFGEEKKTSTSEPSTGSTPV